MPPPIHNPTQVLILSRLEYHQSVPMATQLSNQPPKSLHLNSLIRSPQHKKPRNTFTRPLLMPNLQIHLVLLDTPPPPHPAITNTIPNYQSQAQVDQAQTQQQQINTQTLLPQSGFIAITLQQALLIPSPTRAPQTQPINFANTNKTHSSELPQPIHSASNINEPQDIIGQLKLRDTKFSIFIPNIVTDRW